MLKRIFAQVLESGIFGDDGADTRGLKHCRSADLSGVERCALLGDRQRVLPPAGHDPNREFPLPEAIYPSRINRTRGHDESLKKKRGEGGSALLIGGPPLLLRISPAPAKRCSNPRRLEQALRVPSFHEGKTERVYRACLGHRSISG